MADWRHLFPFEPKFFTLPGEAFSAGNNPPRMHYVDEGVGDRPIVCVHGNPTWSFYYRAVITAFRDQQRVVAVDHVGCGLSDKPQRYRYCLEQHIDNLRALINHLDLNRITLVMHDWGGAIGLGAAVKDLDRIERLVVLNTAAFPPPYMPWQIAACRLPLAGNLAMRGLNLFALAALRMTHSRLPRLEPDVAAGLVAPYGNWSQRVAIARFVQDIPTRPSDSTWQVLESIEQQLSRLADRPASFVWGMRDWCFRPECLERLVRSFPRATVHRLEDVGHYVMEEAAQEVIAAIGNCYKTSL